MARISLAPPAGMRRLRARVRHGEALAYLELPALPSAPYWARQHAGSALLAWQVRAETVETVRLIVSELVTNALHAGTAGDRITLAVRLLPDRVVVGVSDSRPGWPVLADGGPHAEAGRGLMIVQALAIQWGCRRLPAGGKTVYAVIRA